MSRVDSILPENPLTEYEQKKHLNELNSETARWKSAGLTNVKTFVQMQATVGPRCEYEFLTFILPPTPPTSLRLRRSFKEDGQVPE